MTTYRARGRISPMLLTGAVLLALVIGVVIGAVVLRPASPAHRGTSPTTSGASARGTPTTSAPPALALVSLQPAANATGVPGAEPITLTFSSPIAAGSPTPTLSPPVAGSWRVRGTTVTFTPEGAFIPLSTVSVTVPSGSTGVRAADGARLVNGLSEHFRVQNGSVLRLQQLLSLLDYSPLSWAPAGSPIDVSNSAAELAALFQPPAGSFAWTDSGWPQQLRTLWRPGAYNVFTKGLVMSFQADHSLVSNGHVGPGLWETMLQALQSNELNTGGYNYALADKTSPESFTVWHNGSIVLRSSMNTGIAASPTPDGVYPVYTRLRRQVMRGTNPQGTHYADLVQYIAYFNGNDAVHYMDRADYGIPQSLGCIELPLASAARAWPYLAYGTLVTIIH